MKKLVSALLLLFLATPLPLMAADLVETRKANFKQNAAILKAVRDQISMEEWQELADGAQKLQIGQMICSIISRPARPAAGRCLPFGKILMILKARQAPIIRQPSR